MDYYPSFVDLRVDVLQMSLIQKDFPFFFDYLYAQIG